MIGIVPNRLLGLTFQFPFPTYAALIVRDFIMYCIPPTILSIPRRNSWPHDVCEVKQNTSVGTRQILTYPHICESQQKSTYSIACLLLPSSDLALELKVVPLRRLLLRDCLRFSYIEHFFDVVPAQFTLTFGIRVAICFVLSCLCLSTYNTLARLVCTPATRP